MRRAILVAAVVAAAGMAIADTVTIAPGNGVFTNVTARIAGETDVEINSGTSGGRRRRRTSKSAAARSSSRAGSCTRATTARRRRRHRSAPPRPSASTPATSRWGAARSRWGAALVVAPLGGERVGAARAEPERAAGARARRTRLEHRGLAERARPPLSAPAAKARRKSKSIVPSGLSVRVTSDLSSRFRPTYGTTSTKGFSVAAAAGNAPSAAARIAKERCFMPRSISQIMPKT